MNAPSPPLRPDDDDHDPSSSAVLIPLIISMVLVVLGVSVAVIFYITYRRRYRTWLVEFQARRERERWEELEREKKARIGPEWWEVEVGDEGEGDTTSWWGGFSDAEKGWNPVAVTYHSTPSSTSDSDTRRTRKGPDIDPKLSSSTSLTADEEAPARIPERVEMTVLVAMPSPTPMRSRRSSPASSVPSLDLSRSKEIREEAERIEDSREDELPEVQLATVVVPVREAS